MLRFYKSWMIIVEFKFIKTEVEILDAKSRIKNKDVYALSEKQICLLSKDKASLKAMDIDFFRFLSYGLLYRI